jgi:hypothetical protein
MPRPQLRALRLLATAAFVAATTMAAGIQPQATMPPLEDGISFWAQRTPNFPIVPGQAFDLVVVRNVAVGPLHFTEVVDGNPVELGPAGSWEPWGVVNGLPGFRTTFQISNPTEGTHTYQAIFDDDGTHSAITKSTEVDVAKVPTSITMQVFWNPTQTNHEVVFSPGLQTDGSGVQVTGDFVWRDMDTNAVIASYELPGEYALRFTPTSPGTRHIRAEYSGAETYEASVSDVVTLTITNDRVEATGVTIDVANFYPYKDGYRDVVKIKGTRLEPISVAVSIYNSSNRRVRTMWLAQGSGAYSLAWNGRSNAGNLQPAGKYRIVQVLTDPAGMRLSVTKYVNLSNKRIYYSTKYVTKNGSSVSVVGHTGNGSVTVSTTTGIARVRASSGSWAGAGYQFTLPSATLYKSISFQAYVKGALSVPTNWIGIQNFKTCAISTKWYEDCFERWEAIGSGSGVPEWHWTSGSVSNNITGRTARGLVSVYFGSAYVYKVRMKVTIGVLK